MNPTAAIEAKHFDLLKKFGRTPQVRTMTDIQQGHLWSQMCQIESVAAVPLAIVRKEWRHHVSGKSADTGLSIQSLPGSGHTLLGITYKGTLVASHPVKTRSLIRKLLAIHAESFSDPEIYLQDVLGLAPALATPAQRPKP